MRSLSDCLRFAQTRRDAEVRCVTDRSVVDVHGGTGDAGHANTGEHVVGGGKGTLRGCGGGAQQD